MIFPIQVLAYSEYIIAGGENIGIELNAKGIIIVGTYKVNGGNPAEEAGLRIGDMITEINNASVNNIEEMLEKIGNSEKINLSYVRGNKKYSTSLNLIKDNNNILKTGLYVKDSITGIGTLSFIDPNTKLYGALGHEIIEKSTGQKLEIKDGKIYNSTVTSITPSDDGNPVDNDESPDYPLMGASEEKEAENGSLIREQ